MEKLHIGRTQADIARAAGVSTATVSRVLNNSPVVRPEVRMRVENAIHALGYVPHGAARALASSRTHTVGAVIPTLNSEIFAAGINAFERVLAAHGHTLLLAVSNHSPDAEAVQVRRLLERGIDGLLLIGNAHAAETGAMIARSGVAHVNAWAYDPSAGQPNIGFDNRAAMAPVVDHLVGLGHRRIAMMAGIVTGNDRAAERLAGVAARLAHHGLRLEPRRTVQVAYEIDAARHALPALLAGPEAPTAVICGNDVIALGVLFEAQAMGLRVPADLSLTGFDNLPLTRHVHPAVTTVDVCPDAMGERAARGLLAAIGTGRPVAGCELPAPLVVRGTTGTPGGGGGA